MAPDERNGALVPKLLQSSVLSVNDLHRLLDGQMPVTNADGNLRVEIIRGRGQRNQILWVPGEGQPASYRCMGTGRHSLPSMLPLRGFHDPGAMFPASLGQKRPSQVGAGSPRTT